jgi:7-cyano-7-deazaguanine synthase
MTKAMVVFSGGQDSTTCLYWAKHHFDIVQAITFDYGQKHKVEIEAAKEIAFLAGVEHEIVQVPDILVSSSPLTNKDNDLETYSDYDQMDKIIGNRVELTFVPMRNPFFITLAANRAVAKGIFDLVTGVCQMDNANYPDCREKFIDSQANTIRFALDHDFNIHTPLITLTKAETIHLAATFKGCFKALAYSHTCYAGQVPPCGKCHACVLRAHGFDEAKMFDPLILRFGGISNNEVLKQQ